MYYFISELFNVSVLANSGSILLFVRWIKDFTPENPKSSYMYLLLVYINLS